MHTAHTHTNMHKNRVDVDNCIQQTDAALAAVAAVVAVVAAHIDMSADKWPDGLNQRDRRQRARVSRSMWVLRRRRRLCLKIRWAQIDCYIYANTLRTLSLAHSAATQK